MAESFATAAFRHGPLELAVPDLAAIVLATEPETRTLDLGFAADLVDAGATVVVVTTGEDHPPGRCRSRSRRSTASCPRPCRSSRSSCSPGGSRPPRASSG